MALYPTTPLQSSLKKPGVMACTFNPCTRKVEGGGSGLYREFQDKQHYVERTCLKSKQNSQNRVTELLVNKKENYVVTITSFHLIM